jgi:two-component system chemotaxis sensor kinase CheA
MEFEEEIREFLIESNENLANLDRELVELEQNPRNHELISSAFRTIHTIKGTCGFFGYSILQSVTHVTENILSQVRDGQRLLTPGLITLLLESMDAVKKLLASIEATGAEGEDTTGPLRKRLEAAERAVDFPAPPRSATPPPTPAPETISPPQPGADEQESPASRMHPPEATSAAPESSSPPAAAPAPSDTPHDVTAARPAPAAAPATSPAPAEQEMAAPAAVIDPGRESGREGHLTDSTIRVDVTLLNRLINLVGELVLARNQLLQDTTRMTPALLQTSQRLNLITSELQEGIMKTRMQPISGVWNKLPRVVRDLAAQCGKRIRIEMEGADTELDKTVLEAIRDPLTHIVRNACDHGIELPATRISRGKEAEGLLVLRAYHEGGVVNIEISDDGAGIDPARVKAKAVEKGLLRAEQAAQLGERDALELIFKPGFSTAAAITSISGRGVGMDVVKTNIEKIGGSVEVGNRGEGPGQGATLRIKIPLTLAIIPGLLVTLQSSVDPTARDAPSTASRDEERFIIPQANLVELVRVEAAEMRRRIEDVHGTPVFHHRGRLLPLVYLRSVLGRGVEAPGAEAVNIIVVQAENRQMGLVVDRIADTQEIVVKPLGRQLKALICYLGATIMGDGRPALILDVAGVGRLAGLGPQSRGLGEGPDLAAAETQPAEMMLVFTAGGLERVAVPLAMVDRLEEVATADLERAGGRPVVRYRGSILPLLKLEEVFDPGPGNGAARFISPPELAGGQRQTQDVLQVVVFKSGADRIGLVVDRILDIVNEVIVVRRRTGMPALLGSAVLAGRVTDLLDLPAVLARAAAPARPTGNSESTAEWKDPKADADLAASLAAHGSCGSWAGRGGATLVETSL